MHILVVDDSRTIHAFVTEVFTGTPHELHHVFDGEAALVALRQTSYGLVLLDWEMPGLTGPETLSAARAEGCEVPIVMVTTKSDLESIATALERGATDYVMKPFTKDILLGKVDDVLTSRRTTV